jgi:hypothetical protein
MRIEVPRRLGAGAAIWEAQCVNECLRITSTVMATANFYWAVRRSSRSRFCSVWKSFGYAVHAPVGQYT